MGNEVLAVFVIFAVLVLFELEQIRKYAAHMRMMMELEQSTWRAACKDIGLIRQMLQSEILDERDRRVRQAAMD